MSECSMRLMILRDRTLDQVEACRSSARTSPRAINVVPAESVTTAPIWIPPEFEGTEYVNVGRFAAKAHGIKSSHTPSKRMLSAWHKFSAAREKRLTIVKSESGANVR